MDEKYTIGYLEEPAWEVIGRGLREYNKQQAGPELGENVCFALYNLDQSIIGGVIGDTHWGWLHVILLWIPEELRGQGYGHALMQAIEDEARKRGCSHAYLDTFSFQSPKFYQEHGYRVFGVLPDFPPGQQRYYMAKDL